MSNSRLPFYVRSASSISSFEAWCDKFLSEHPLENLINLQSDSKFLVGLFYPCIFIMFIFYIYNFVLSNSWVVCPSMGSLTLLRTILMAFFYCIFLFCKLPLNCNKCTSFRKLL